MAICEKKKVHCDNDWGELSEESLRVVLLWFPYCAAYHGYFFKVRCLRVVVVGVNLIFYICVAPVLFGGGCFVCRVYLQTICEFMGMGQIESTGALSIMVFIMILVWLVSLLLLYVRQKCLNNNVNCRMFHLVVCY